MSTQGARASGCQRPQLLLDGDSTHYSGSEGFASTQWNAKPPPGMVVTLKRSTAINTIRFLLWDADPRFYRYRLEVSPDQNGARWRLVADRSKPPRECRSWQTIGFKKQRVWRIRLTGTYNSANSGFHVVELQAYLFTGRAFPPDAGLEF